MLLLLLRNVELRGASPCFAFEIFIVLGWKLDRISCLICLLVVSNALFTRSLKRMESCRNKMSTFSLTPISFPAWRRNKIFIAKTHQRGPKLFFTVCFPGVRVAPPGWYGQVTYTGGHASDCGRRGCSVLLAFQRPRILLPTDSGFRCPKPLIVLRFIWWTIDRFVF